MLTDSILGNQVGWGAVVVYLLQRLKQTPWFPWINAHTDIANRILSVLLAIGITVTITGTLQTGGTINIAFPDFHHLLSAISHAAAQIAIQEVIYRGAVKPSMPQGA